MNTAAPLRAARTPLRIAPLDAQELQTVWQQFIASKEAGSPDHDLQNRLVGHYYPLVIKKVANKLHQKITEVQPEELASMGVDGLYDAVMGYDPLRKTKFETYATPRIRGAMLDEIRKADWIPRLVRAKCAWFDKQKQKHESNVGRRLTNAELAELISADSSIDKPYAIKSEADLEEFVQSSLTPAVHSVNELTEDDDGMGKGGLPIDQAEDTNISQPLDSMVREELFAKLMGSSFAPIERKIIWLYYFEDRSMKEISERVKLSESRVSQMHGMILRRLKQKAERNPEYFADIWSMISGFRGFHAVVS